MNDTVTLSTSDVDGRDAAAYWRDVVCSAFVEVAVRPTEEDGFAGVVRHRDVAGIGFARLSSCGQRVDRTRGYVARSNEHHLLANIQISGQGLLAQDGRGAVLTPGVLAFVDSARPYTMHFGGEFAQLVVRIPVSMLPRRTLRDATSTALDGPARLVTDFLLGMENLGADELVPHALGLVDTALGWAAGRTGSRRWRSHGNVCAGSFVTTPATRTSTPMRWRPAAAFPGGRCSGRWRTTSR
ncbi:cupin domain-containing protein [Kutzneria chonburiensis]|uniref:cupin domain-containing protein n=1 Tax=Kutzneria chonburiensis TaxID=1483604 RepID=UPI0023619D3E|nr:hypothetical protein [Kutzneria chonburiensis]